MTTDNVDTVSGLDFSEDGGADPGDEAPGRARDPDGIDGPDAPDPELATKEEFRQWYASRFAIAGALAAPMTGGMLQSLMLDPHDDTVARAADSLYEHAERKGWRWLIRKPSGAVGMIEAQAALGLQIVVAARHELAERRAAAEAAAGTGHDWPDPERDRDERGRTRVRGEAA